MKIFYAGFAIHFFLNVTSSGIAKVYPLELRDDAAPEGSRAKAISATACGPMVRDPEELECNLHAHFALVDVQGERLSPFRKATCYPLHFLHPDQIPQTTK